MSLITEQFHDEIVFVRDIAHDFAKVHPQLLQFIIEDEKDPDVERLIEGLAYITSQLKLKLKSGLPELIQSLLVLLWPSYLKPIPSLTILEASVHDKTASAMLRKGNEIKYQATGEVSYAFQTCRDLLVTPLVIQDLQLSHHLQQNSLIIDFVLDSDLKLNNLNDLQFYLGEDSYVGSILYMMLLNYVVSGCIIVNGVELPLTNLRFNPIGFNNEQTLLPYADNTNKGFRTLHEYFAFPEGFLFLQLSHDDKNLFPISVNYNHFQLKINFSYIIDSRIKLRKDMIKLNCVPAINLFYHDAEPILLDGKKEKYPLEANYQYSDNFEIYSVVKVESKSEKNKITEYYDFNRFEYKHELHKGPERHFYNITQTQDKRMLTIRHWISFVRSDEKDWIGNIETISVKLLCSNKDKPSQLKIGDLNQVISIDHNNYLTLKNIIRPTLQLVPMIDETQYWTTISNLAKNYKSLLQKDILKQIFQSYHFPAMHNPQQERTLLKILSGIVKIDSNQIERKLANRMVVRGVKTYIHLSQSVFKSEGELYLWGTVLAHFLAQQAALNSFHLLVLVNIDNQERYTWPVKVGQHLLI
ncbi:MAG: type VI secretion system baseplate subunit TssF [Gilliamella sp.]|uniref:type VI secretion system baseplate subunit TssF n=1 Tax=Gilliamella sp. TaxID=1891236 RepID=UPI0025FF5F67|nr:type VI secretion system baseplate subunit TssF [Gilliamella sp.]MCO6538095.1 type VI secretion system baseplate subunit TssF [Gilliamella sp.]MCO6540246.1 type VI secretion system baseplate subunit TssF [Gilliamella sp.]